MHKILDVELSRAVSHPNLNTMVLTIRREKENAAGWESHTVFLPWRKECKPLRAKRMLELFLAWIRRCGERLD